jgi:prepilin-type N-terminal cleavage/methylation domain-containing protein
MYPKSTHRRNNDAFTLVEILVALLIFGIIYYSASVFMGTFKKQSVATQDAIEQALDISIGDRLIRQNIVDLAPSFNLLTLKDDHLKNFYDLFTDVTCTQDCERIFSMRPKPRPDKAFYMLIIDDVISAQTYHPPQAYKITKPVNPNLDTPATIVYQGINYQDYLLKILPFNSDRTRAFWDSSIKGRLIQFYSMVALRPTSPAGEVDYSVPSRSLSYVGYLRFNHTGDWEVKAGAGGIDQMSISGSKPTGINITAQNPENLLNLSHPKKPNLVMTDISDASGTNGFDRFLRTLPPVGGVDAIAFFRPIKLLKFYLEEVKEKGKPIGKLWREEWDPETKTWMSSQRLMVSSGLYGVVLKRRTISSPVVELVIARNEGQFTRAQRLGIDDKTAEEEAKNAEKTSAL